MRVIVTPCVTGKHHVCRGNIMCHDNTMCVGVILWGYRGSTMCLVVTLCMSWYHHVCRGNIIGVRVTLCMSR